MLVTSWDEAVEKLGFSYDWESYTLCEFMYSHLQLFGAQPVIFCNILDPEAMKKAVEAKDYDVTDHKATLPIGAVAGSIKVKATVDVEGTPTEQELKADEDYSISFLSRLCFVLYYHKWNIATMIHRQCGNVKQNSLIHHTFSEVEL